MTLRVVHVASGREWRGGQRQVWLLARELARGGDVDQVVVTGARQRARAPARARTAMPVHESSLAGRASTRACCRPLVARARSAVPALLHAHDAHAVTLGGVAARLTGRPFVATRRVDFPLRRPGLLGPAPTGSSRSPTPSPTCSWPTASRPSRITVVHFGIDLAELRRTTRLGLRDQLWPPTRKPASRPTSRRWWATRITRPCCDAAALCGRACPDLHWVVAGEGPLRGALERLRAELGLAGRVHLLGHLAEPARSHRRRRLSSS